MDVIACSACAGRGTEEKTHPTWVDCHGWQVQSSDEQKNPPEGGSLFVAYGFLLLSS